MKLKKEITFIYMDSSEKGIYTSLSEEAIKRGYKVNMTTNQFQKCEIGFYCQHVNFPQYSKFSVIMLHDIIQQYSNWPDIWLREPWNKYDVGILPSNQWVENWNKCSQWYYTNPRLGMYKVGWPKADIINKIKEQAYRDTFYQTYNLDLNKKTVLYAPSWENDGKQDDFVQAMLKLDVNILIKQYDADPAKFPEFVKNVQEMYNLHKDNPRVTILPAKTNIFEAIAVSDILVSDESSTMAEATMMGIPAVSVSNWLIPDETPSRYPQCNYDFVTFTTKEELTETIRTMINDYSKFKAKAEADSEHNFSNVGKSSEMIMDIIDDIVNNQNVRYEKLVPNKKQNLSIKHLLSHLLICFRREMFLNYRVRYKAVAVLWELIRKIKKIVK